MSRQGGEYGQIDEHGMQEYTCEGGHKTEFFVGGNEGPVCAALCKMTGTCIATRMTLNNVTPVNPEAHLYEQNGNDVQE